VVLAATTAHEVRSSDQIRSPNALVGAMSDEFQRLVATLDYPMFVVTAASSDGTERSGCLVGFASQCSIHPPRFMVWISVMNHTYDVARWATHLGVHVVGRQLAELFGGETGDEVDKFARCRWHVGPNGVPVLDGATGWFVGRVVDRLDTGDHLGFLLEPVEASAPDDDQESVTFQQVKGLEPGHDP
jgi:flavin reductase (DIM6/NTAB) family NADH-FMN oxidoreductase RutF